MQTRRLGADGPLISAIGIGAMSFSDFYGATDEAQSHAILQTALDEGVTHIDTANVYGPHKSEAAIGSFLAKQGNRRSDMFSIATKAGIARDPTTGARRTTIPAIIWKASSMPRWRASASTASICSTFTAGMPRPRSRRSPRPSPVS